MSKNFSSIFENIFDFFSNISADKKINKNNEEYSIELKADGSRPSLNFKNKYMLVMRMKHKMNKNSPVIIFKNLLRSKIFLSFGGCENKFPYPFSSIKSLLTIAFSILFNNFVNPL
jgi:hypothetical protein